MSLMGTLAKVAIGYAAARGVDSLSRSRGGMPGQFGGAQVPADEARAEQAPGMGSLQDMLGQMASGAGMGDLQNMIANMAKQSGFDLSAIMGGAAAQPGGREDKGGLLSAQPGAGGGLAGILAALGGAAAATGAGTGKMLDQISTAETAPQAEEAAALMLRAMIQSAKADGTIDKAEQAKILDTVGADADAEDIAFVKAQLKAPVDIGALAKDTPEPLKMQVYSMSLMPIRLDTRAEADYLDELARALGLNQQTVNALHLQMGVQPLYA